MIIARLIDDKGNEATFEMDDADIVPPRYCIRRGQVWAWQPLPIVETAAGIMIATYRRTAACDLSALEPLTVTLADKQKAA